MFSGQRKDFSISNASTTGRSCGKKMNLHLYLMYTEKNYLKWIINLNIKAKVMKFLEESITIIFVTWHRQRFLGTQKTLTIEEKT